jgi:hypothetical protein
MFDDPDYMARVDRARTHRPVPAGEERARTSMTAAIDPTNHWSVRGDPTRLAAAAAALRAGNAEQIFGTRFPGEYVMTGVARLLEAIANKIHERVDLGHDVVSAATEVAEHALVYVQLDEAQR